TVIMRENLEEMNARGVNIPVLLGGAALNRKYVEGDCRKKYDGSLYYARDAFDALDIMARIKGGETRPDVVVFEERKKKLKKKPEVAVLDPDQAEQGDKSLKDHSLDREITYPTAPFLGARIVEDINLQSVTPFINERTLFQFQWGYRRKGMGKKEYDVFIEQEVRPKYFDLLKQCAQEKILLPKSVYGFWKCVPEGDTLRLLHPEDESREVASFAFPRQVGKKHRCISDYFHTREGEPDVIALQAVTVGQQATEVALEWFGQDRYKDYLHLHGLSVETAEGLAEYTHTQVRADLGMASEDAREKRALLAQGYRGARFSFGYPACPNLSDQEQLLDLLGADRIGLKLGDEDQLWPEQSTSAIVCHHPAARYFTI
ncbi:MAG: 5-methyltetrahydrofolate--homocysteine methyltransferase, partial [Planctomycetota bacterium]